MTNINILARNNVNIEGNRNSSKTLIFAHGFGTDQTAWKRVKKVFSEDYRIILYDNVGAGRSDLNAYSLVKYQNLQGYAEDLLQIGKSLDIHEAVFVGHSVSSMIGLLATIKAPELFSKLVLIGASPRYLNAPGYTGGFDQKALDQLYSTMASNYHEWAAGFSKLAMRNSHNPSLSEEFAHSLQSIRPDIAFAVARSIFQSDCRSILDQINAETLLIQAKKDIVVPDEVALYLNSSIKKSKLVKINAEGHLPHISAPEEIINAIKAFIESESDVRSKLATANG